MEKQIKMSLELAQLAYKLIMAEKDPISPTAQALSQILIQNFTLAELEGKKGFTWEESFNGYGYEIVQDTVIGVNNKTTDFPLTPNRRNKFLYKTEAQAKSALAFSQLTHIVSKYNEGKKFDYSSADRAHLIYLVINNKQRTGVCVTGMLHESTWEKLYFLTREDAETSLQVNKELWEQYHMIGETVSVKVTETNL